jgi:hypothetical protein
MYSFIHCKLVHTRDLTQDRPKAGNLKLLRVPLSVSSVPASPSFSVSSCSYRSFLGASWDFIQSLFGNAARCSICGPSHSFDLFFHLHLSYHSQKNCPCLRFNGLGEFIVGRYPLAKVCMLFEVLWLFFRSWSHEEAQT